MANACCHRGAKVMQDGKGTASAHGHVCPYHAWTYDSDGTLKWAPGMHTVDSFDEDIRLPVIRHDLWNGFIFVTLNDDAPAVRDSLGDLPDVLPDWFSETGALKDMVTVARRQFTVNCNWKFLMENTW
jgi:choline monooxygenase